MMVFVFVCLRVTSDNINSKPNKPKLLNIVVNMMVFVFVFFVFEISTGQKLLLF